MKLTANRDQLFAAFSQAAAVAPKRSPKPILSGVKLDASQSGVTLTATDLEVSITCPLAGADVNAPGRAVVPADRFAQIVRESPDATIQIEADDKSIKISGSRSVFTIGAQDPADFPPVRAFNTDEFFEVDAAALKTLFGRTVFGCDPTSSRYALGGVKLEVASDVLIAIATDGRRLAKAETKITGGQATLPDIAVIPERAVQIICRALKLDGKVRLAVIENDVCAELNATTVAARLLEGRFPRWRDVLPKRVDRHEATIPVGTFAAVVRQASITTSEESRGVDFQFAGGSVVLTSRTADVGESRIECPIRFGGPPVSITLDPRFVLDFLATLPDAGTCSLWLRDSESAALFTTDDGFEYVVMPLSKA